MHSDDRTLCFVFLVLGVFYGRAEGCTDIWTRPFEDVPSQEDCQAMANVDSSGFIALSSDGSTIAVPCQGAGAIVYELIDDGSGGSNSWTQKGSFLPRNGVGFSNVQLSMDGDIVAILGQVPSVFVFDGGDWSPLGNSPLENIMFANRLALSDDGLTLAFVFAPTDRAAILELNTDTNTWEDKGNEIAASDTDENVPGSAIALSPDGLTVALSGVNIDAIESQTGIVRVFQYDTSSSVWSQLGQSLSSPEPGDLFGASMALSTDGTTLAIGAPTSNGPGEPDDFIGEALVYTLQGNSWVQIGEDIEGAGSICSRPGSGQLFSPTNGFCTDGTGLSVDLTGSGSTIVIGPQDPEGYLRVFELDSVSEWKQVGGDIFGNPHPQEVSVSSDGSLVAWGLFGQNTLVIRRECVVGGVPAPTQAPYEPPGPRCRLGPLCPLLDLVGGLAALVAFCFFLS